MLVHVDCHHSLHLCGDRMKMSLLIKKYIHIYIFFKGDGYHLEQNFDPCADYFTLIARNLFPGS